MIFEFDEDTISLDGLRVLVVEDDADSRNLLASFLKHLGAFVETADNGLEGVTMSLLGSYDVILMDIMMPVVDGYTAVAHLRKQGFIKPIVACTALGLEEKVHALKDVGFTDFCHKPLELDALARKTKRLHIREQLRLVSDLH